MKRGRGIFIPPLRPSGGLSGSRVGSCGRRSCSAIAGFWQGAKPGAGGGAQARSGGGLASRSSKSRSSGRSSRSATGGKASTGTPSFQTT